MTDSEVKSEGEESKGAGCLKVLQIGFAIIGFIVVLRALGAISNSFGNLTTLCCVGLVLIVILIVVFVFQGRRKVGRERKPEPRVAHPPDAQVAYEQGERLHYQGKREEAVAAFLQAYREGSPAVRKQALTALEKLGEVEKF